MGNLLWPFIVFLVHLKCAENSRILAIMPEPVSSHFIMMERLMKALAEKGHEVDVVSHFPQKEKIPRYNDLSIAGTVPSIENNITIEIVEELGFWGDLVFMFKDYGYELCETVFNTSIMKELKLTNKKYDLLITEIFGTDCFLGFMHHFNIPSIVLTTSVNLPWGGDRFGNIDNPSYIPSYYVPYLDEMNFLERFINTGLTFVLKMMYEVISVWNSEAVARDFFGPNMPPLKTLMNNVSLMLVNSHFSTNFARPTVPNFIEVGGLHVRDPKPLPKHFENLIKSKSDSKGVIFLTMGSMVMTESFSNDKLQSMFDALGELPYIVLWKAVREGFNNTLKIPSNIHFEKWMPQLDILCHPNTKLFISHGGLMGSQEAITCGVPRLGIPIFGDQHLNIKSSETIGLAIKIDYEQITYKRFSDALNKILDENEGYKQRCVKMAKLFKDRPTTPLDTAIYWVEYVIQHRGAPHLRVKGADLPWYSYYLVDVSVVFLVLIVIFLTIIFGFIKVIEVVVKGAQKCIKKKMNQNKKKRN